jgi:hypothetical protein
MSVSSANISTSGLVFCYDTDNIKGYVGPEMRNTATSITAYAHGSGTGYSFLTGTETSYIPKLDATITNNYSDIQNTGASWCCPNPFTFGTGLPISGSTLYTYAIVYKCNSGYTSGNYMYRYEYNGGTYVTEAGVFSDSNRVDLGNGWYWAWGTFTTQATTNLIYLYAFYYQYRNVYDRLSIAYALLTKGDYSKLHPRFWQSSGGAKRQGRYLGFFWEDDEGGLGCHGGYAGTGNNSGVNRHADSAPSRHDHHYTVGKKD